MKEFSINEFLKLKLEDGKTVIYVNNKRIIQCKYLLLNNISNYSEETKIKPENITMDVQAENLDHSLELNDEKEIEIPPEAEFWAHCSNLQVWYENNYNTEVLHSNLAFPLLRKLTEAGDKTAKEVFKTEITKRFRSGNLNVMVFLIKEGFLDHLDIEESDDLYRELDFKIYKKLQELLKISNKKREGFIIKS
jgi:hypothetical protein